MMGAGNFTDEFEHAAVAQITERGYLVGEVSERLGVNKHSLSAWKRTFAKTAAGDTEKDGGSRWPKCGGMVASLINQMHAADDGSRRLKRMYTDLSMQANLHKEALEENDAAISMP